MIRNAACKWTAIIVKHPKEDIISFSCRFRFEGSRNIFYKLLDILDCRILPWIELPKTRVEETAINKNVKFCNHS